MLVRDPYEALIAEFNRRQSGENHTGHAQFKHSSDKTKWKIYVNRNITTWATTNTGWFNTVHPSILHVVYYDELVSDTQNVLTKVLDFLNIDIDEHSMKCAMEHKEGLFHRPKKPIAFELFDLNMQKTINRIKDSVYMLLKSGIPCFKCIQCEKQCAQHHGCQMSEGRLSDFKCQF